MNSTAKKNYEVIKWLEKWPTDMIPGKKKSLRIQNSRSTSLIGSLTRLPPWEEQHELQEKIQELEKKKRRQRQQIFDLEDEIAQKRDDLTSVLEHRMTQKKTSELLFMIEWKVI